MSTTDRTANENTPRRIVVVGGGMAATHLVEELLTCRNEADPFTVTVLGEERHPAYNRVLLPEVLAGRHQAESIALPASPHEDTPGVTVRREVRVIRMDREARMVFASDGSVTRYDHLVLATGSNPVLPPLRGLHASDDSLKGGVFALRTLEDCIELLEVVPEATRAVVIGGGLLGVGVARALGAHGLPVEIVHQAPHLMERHLDEGAARTLKRTLERFGVTTYVENRARALRGTDRVTGVELASGHVLDCDLVVLACGARPRTHLAAAAGLEVRTGVVVDDQLRSVTDPAIHAIGDCAEHRGVTYGLAAPTWEQAALLARLLSGAEPEAAYTGSVVLARLSAAGVDMAAFGETTCAPGKDAQVVQLSDATRGSYKKVVIRDDRVVGGILIGDLATVGTLTQAYERGEELPPDRLHLLTS